MGWGAWGLPGLEVGWPTVNPCQHPLPACVAFGGAGLGAGTSLMLCSSNPNNHRYSLASQGDATRVWRGLLTGLRSDWMLPVK